MKCPNCGENEVNFRFTQIVNGKKTEINLCSECAREMGLDNISLKMPARFSGFFDNMFNDTFFDMPRLGFDTMYGSLFDNSFDLRPNLVGQVDDEYINEREREEKVKDIVESRAKIKSKENSKKHETNSQLKLLQERLEKEIKEERYEDAAKTRDEIKKLK